MKNTAYAFAKDHLDGSIEALRPRPGRALPRRSPGRRARRSTSARTTGARSTSPARPRPTRSSAAARGPGSRRSPRPRGGVVVEAGVEDLIVMKTTRSAFSGFPRDRYTTLPETDDRLMATKVTAIWRYGSPDLDFDATSRRPHDAARGLRRPRQPVASRPRSGSWPRRSSSATTRSRRSGWCCRTSTTGWSTCRRSGSRTTARSTSPTTEPHGLIEATVRRGEG